MSAKVVGIPEADHAVSSPAVLGVSSSQVKAAPALESVQAPPMNSVASATAPFADFVGRCFLRACLWIDVGTEWIHTNQPPTREQVESEAARKYDWHVAGWFRSSLGVASCTLIAAALVALFWSSSLRSVVPFVFVAVISYTALRFGSIAGIVGTICAALLFASVLFEPRPSLAISDPVERNHLILMVVLGICASELLGRRKSRTVYQPWE